MKKINGVKIFKIIMALFVVIILIGITVYMFPIMTNLASTEGQSEFKNRIQNSGIGGMLMLFGLEFAQVFLFILPGEPLEILSGMCYGAVGGTIFLMVSVCIISVFIFFIVRKFGKKFVYEFCNEKQVKQITENKLFNNPKKIEVIFAILFFIPGTPKDLLVYIAGLLPINPYRFILISTFARFPSIITSTIAGAHIINGNWQLGIVMYAIILVITGIIVFFINKFDKEKKTDELIKILKEK